MTSDLALLAPFWREPVTRTVLPNGLTVLLKPDASAPVASVQVWVKTGSIHENAHLGAGLSHYLEHMLFKGTARRAGREISATVQAHGGYINAYTTFDRTVYYIDLPSEHAAIAIDLLADLALHSTLPEDETAREKDVILREIDMCRDDPDQRLSEALFETAFRQHPYRYPIIGYRSLFASITRDQLLAYYRARYVPNNITLVIAGQIDPAAILPEIDRHFGSAPRALLAPVLVPGEPAQLAPRALHLHEDVEITRAGLAWQIPGLTHPDAPLLDLLATILGGGDSSILWQTVREKKRLVHAIDAHSWTPGAAGLFTISYTCDPARRAPAAEAVHEILGHCAASLRALTPAHLKKAIRQLTVSEINTRKTMSGQAARLGAAEVVIGDLDHARIYFERLHAATPADLRRVLKTHLVPEHLTTVSLNPVENKPAAATSATCNPLGRKPAAANPQFEELRLPNGARLLLQPDHHLPNLHLRLLHRGGPLHEEPGKRGATQLLATLLTRDTRRRTAAEVAQHIEEAGGAFYPFAGNNSLGLALEVLPTDAGRALTLLDEAIRLPAFAPASFATEREAQLAALLQDDDDVVTYGQKLLRQKFFGPHPLALNAAGDAPGLRALAPADLRALWKKIHVAENTILAVAGDFDPRKLVPELKALLARIPRGGLPAPDAPKQLPAYPGEHIERQPREQAVVYQAYPGPALRAADYYVGEVADELFSGMSSRLFERVREEKGLAYFVRSTRITGLDTAMFAFYAGTAPAHQAQVLDEIDAEIRRIQTEGPADDELARCRTRLKAARRMSLQTNSSRAMQAGLNALYGQPVNDWQNYDAHIDAVTIDALRAFARTYFKKELCAQLIVTP
ncbi:peptidase M16 [Termitidicoccus mucosus]|uniref:Peptidase M16 n=1 Tax=Termitidicoccus mucosus TaxID=1184151 RepID=A0A178IAJ5_9BACT|nr:peptidase M16 [Opitutaceae bacterium TSB47]